MPNGPYNWNSGGAAYDNSNRFGQVQVPPNMMGNMQSQNVRPSYIPGRMISNLNEIVPQEVPMDGSAAIFPANDLSCIYLKAWGSDGLIKTFKFIPETQNSEEKTPEEKFQETVLNRLDSIEKTLRRPQYKKPYHKDGNRFTPQSKEENLNGESK